MEMEIRERLSKETAVQWQSLFYRPGKVAGMYSVEID